MTFPFLYFGHAPADWYEGANFGHVVEVQLRDSPSAQQRETLATLFEHRFAKGPVTVSPRQPWSWSGAYFCFSFGERWSGAGKSAFSAVTDFLLEVHRQTPIAEAQLWSARENGDSRWHLWTLTQRAHPSPRPVYHYEPANLIFLAKRDPALGKYALDPLFEKARENARTSQTISQAVTMEGPLRLVPVEKPALRIPTPEELALFETPDPSLNLRKPPVMHGDYAEKFANRVWAWRYENSARVSFIYLDDAGIKKTLQFQGKMSAQDFAIHLHGPFIHRSGCFAYFRLPNSVFELDFTTGTFQRRFSSAPGETIHALAWLEGDTWAMLSSQGLALLDMSTEKPRVLTNLPASRTRLNAIQNRLLVTSQWSDKPILFGAVDGQLKKLANVEIKAHFVDTDGEFVFIIKDGVYFRLEGWEPLVEEFVTKVRAKAAKSPKKKTDEWEAVECAAPPLPTFPEQSRPKALISAARSGARLVMYPSAPDVGPYFLRYDRLEAVTAEGLSRDSSLPGQSFRGMAISPSGQVAMAILRGENDSMATFAFFSLADGSWRFPEGTLDLANKDLRGCEAWDDTTLAVLVGGALSIWSFASGTAESLATADVPSALSLAVAPNRGMLAVLGTKKENVTLLRWNAGKLRKVARLPGRLVELHVYEDEFYGKDPEGQWSIVRVKAPTD